MVFFLTEIINKTSIHPIQYVLIGSALVIFYILLVSFSEHLTFNWSYLISSISIITLIGLYTQSVFKNRKFSIMLSSILCIMYTFIYIIIQMEDFALLSGSIGLFIILASTMYYSRKIDWYAMNNLVKI
jgi:inner membrane protein